MCFAAGTVRQMRLGACGLMGNWCVICPPPGMPMGAWCDV